MRIVLFDIDGTLIRSNGAGKRAADRAFELLFQVPNSWGDLRADGRTDPDIFEEISARVLGRALEENEQQLLHRTYLSHLTEELNNPGNLRVLPGVHDLCQSLLGEKHTTLGLQTGNLEEAAWLKLRVARLADFFQFGGFGTDSTNRGEFVRLAIERAQSLHQNTPASDVIVIGDTPRDIAAGKYCGARTIAVATGSYSVAELRQEAPDFAVENLGNTKEILAVIKGA